MPSTQCFFFVVSSVRPRIPVCAPLMLPQIKGLVIENTFTSLREVAESCYPALKPLIRLFTMVQVSDSVVCLCKHAVQCSIYQWNILFRTAHRKSGRKHPP